MSLHRLSQTASVLRVKGLGGLTEPVCCVVQLATQPVGVVHQVVLDPGKVKAVVGAEVGGKTPFLIRLGEWPGDEARGWQWMENIVTLVVLGRATREGDVVTVVPREEDA